jgi:hypothetical protein
MGAKDAPKKGGNLKSIVIIVLLFPLVVFLYIYLTSSASENNVKNNNPTGGMKTDGTLSENKQPKGALNNQVSTRKKIAYAITVTKDGHFVDGALMLGYSALKVHDAKKGFNSKYDAELIAFVTPSVKYARPILESYGWKVLEKGLPVTLEEIENKEYAEGMRNSGCCGADEFLKLW